MTDTPDSTEQGKSDEVPPNGPKTRPFWLLTIAYGTAVLIGSALLGFFDPARVQLDPHEWGDVLAGIFSPVAFLWLVYASLSQKTELELQRGELAQNNDSQVKQFQAMRKQAESLQAQADMLKAQADLVAHDRAMAASQMRVWKLRYLQGVLHFHHEIIDQTANIGRKLTRQGSLIHRDVVSDLDIDTLHGTGHVESGLERFHHFDQATSDGLMEILASIDSVRRMGMNLRARTLNEALDPEQAQGAIGAFNSLATKAHNIASAGIVVHREEVHKHNA